MTKGRKEGQRDNNKASEENGAITVEMRMEMVVPFVFFIPLVCHHVIQSIGRKGNQFITNDDPALRTF